MKAITLILLAVLLGFAAINLMNTTTVESTSEVAQAYKQWCAEYGKNFAGPDAEFRFAVFAENYAKIQRDNEEQNEVVYGLNQFSDLTQEEFVSTYLGYDGAEAAQSDADVEIAEIGDINADVDWRNTEGVVTKVKNQGQCGSCWAFSATGSMEGVSMISKGNSVNLSESQLVDCSSSYGNHGCQGGLMGYAFDYVKANGITSEQKYPYVPRQSSCKYNKSDAVFQVSGYKRNGRSTSALKSSVTKQPTSIAVDASRWSSYRSGVFSTCGSSLNHGVLAVGYTDSYWIVKNSWGAGWGEKGYIRLKMGNTCGCLNQSSYPIA